MVVPSGDRTEGRWRRDKTVTVKAFSCYTIPGTVSENLRETIFYM